MNYQHQKKGRFTHHLALSFVTLTLCSLFFSSCGSGGDTSSPTLSPSPMVQGKDVRVVMGCFATSTDYPRAYFQNAVNTLASWLAASVKPGAPETHIYLNSLENVGGDAADGSLFTLAIPAIESIPPKPVTTNPLDPKLTHWQKDVNAIQTHVQQVQQEVNTKLATLRSLSPNVTAPSANGLANCLVSVHQVFSTPTEEGKHILLLASPLYPLPHFAKDFLNNVTVVGMGMYCADIVTCDYKGYAARLYSLGSASVVLYNESQFVPSPF